MSSVSLLLGGPIQPPIYVHFYIITRLYFESAQCFPGGSVGKESACHAGDLVLISGLGRSPGEGIGNPLQYSCLDREAWKAIVHRVTRVRHDLVTKMPVNTTHGIN